MNKVEISGLSKIKFYPQLQWNVSVTQVMVDSCNWENISSLKGYKRWNRMNKAELSIH